MIFGGGFGGCLLDDDLGNHDFGEFEDREEEIGGGMKGRSCGGFSVWERMVFRKEVDDGDGF